MSPRFLPLPRFLVLLACAFVGVVHAAGPSFSRDILPILSDACFQCHGQDAKARKADLRLDIEAEAKRPHKDSTAIIPGNSAESDIVIRMVTADDDDHMPPAKSHKVVTPRQIELIKQWIDAGAKWGEHWAFTRIEKPKIPTVPAETGVNPIDAFVTAKLGERHLAFSPEATPETLIRRVSLDLTGIPPTPEEVEAFRQSKSRNSKSAMDSLVDRLLASPRHGERWVWEWLDASRYADSNGYQGDNDRTMWPWRDWVINAINTNMPYDQFSIWQLAGDLMPNATREQKLATAFVRNHMINGEGGRIAEENRIEYLFDQAETVGTVWLGLTMQCTRCHDHKFDPLTQQDYYGLISFFNGTPVDGQGRGGQTPPILDMSTPAEEQKSKAAQERVNKLAKEVEAFELTKFPRPEGKSLEESDAIRLPGNLPSYIAKTPPFKRGVDPLLESVNYFKAKDAAYAAVLEKLLGAVRKRDGAKTAITKVMVLEERKEGPRDTFILTKGAYDNPTTTKAVMTTPGKLPSMPAGSPNNRLGLAKWLVSRDNPLTARVTVNRYWQSLFGIGLVKTAEDFGLQGERPLHMDLLDWLAADFMDHGWDVKHLLKLIVTSRTYQQSSKLKPGPNDDPENRLLSRGPRFRMPSFMMRDQALAVSGLLAEQTGGPAVKPYQPEGIWEEATFGKIKYTPDTGAKLYRRSLYTFWRRIVGPTMFFDTASRQTCTVKASRTNTPLQALITLNETTFIESARALAQRVLTSRSLATDDERLAMTWKVAACRDPNPVELQKLKATLMDFRQRFATDVDDANKLLGIGDSKRNEELQAREHAAWTSLCLLILNLDEVLNKE
ncbi:MAG: hypothetical protein JWO08_1314 [Verrucomicrobiaceae bacterium]|nr:hypothetical protein [Verrucomicrobiaceae bacterium]